MTEPIITSPEHRSESTGPTSVEDLTCPKCNVNLAFYKIIVETYPYIHADLTLFCVHCKRTYLFGIPFDPIAGMTRMLFTDKLTEAVNAMQSLTPPICPFHREEMKPTKFFGSPISPNPILQFKCGTCFFIRHVQAGKD